MGMIRTTLECSASAVITGVFFLFPLGVAFWPDLNSRTEFIPMGGDGAPRAELAMMDLSALVSEPDEPTHEGTPEPLPEPEEAVVDAEEQAIDPESPVEDVQIAEVIESAQPTSVPESKSHVSSERQSATRAGQAAAKRRQLEEALAEAETEKKPGKGKGKGKGKCLAPDDRITRTTKGAYSIDDELVEEYTRSLEAAARLASVGWHEDAEGDVDGFQIFRVRCGSPLHQAGLRNRDVIHSINGKQIRTYAQGLVAWKLMRKKKKVEVVFKRKGELRTMTYRVS